MNRLKHFCILTFTYFFMSLLICIGTVATITFILWLVGISLFGNVLDFEI